MINNELVLTDTNSEFVRVRFEFVAIYFSIPAPILSSTLLPPFPLHFARVPVPI